MRSGGTKPLWSAKNKQNPEIFKCYYTKKSSMVVKINKKNEALVIVREYIQKAKDNPNKGDFYIKKLRKVAMKVNLRLPRQLKRKFCKHCYSYFTGDNYRVRTRNKTIVYYCFKCKKYSRIGLKEPK